MVIIYKIIWYISYFTICCYFLAFNDARGHEMERPNYIQDLLSANWTDVMTITESNSSRGIINFFILLFFLLSFFFLAFKKKKKKKRTKWNRNPNYDDDTNFEEGQSASSSFSSEWRDRSPQYQDYDYRG